MSYYVLQTELNKNTSHAGGSVCSRRLHFMSLLHLVCCLYWEYLTITHITHLHYTVNIGHQVYHSGLVMSYTCVHVHSTANFMPKKYNIALCWPVISIQLHNEYVHNFWRLIVGKIYLWSDMTMYWSTVMISCPRAQVTMYWCTFSLTMNMYIALGMVYPLPEPDLLEAVRYNSSVNIYIIHKGRKVLHKLT